MTNKQQLKANKSQKDQAKKLPQLQQLQLEQLDDVTGGVLLFANPFA
ncbi:hypothetical protein [Calothrix rhizosoleniae]|nr:hypothetical protein [Calothrix rhizosoleniae]